MVPKSVGDVMRSIVAISTEIRTQNISSFSTEILLDRLKRSQKTWNDVKDGLTSYYHDAIELNQLAHAHIPLVKNYTYFRVIQSYPMRHLADLP